MTKANENKDDLFESSTMTFGEHLEELRRSLLKAAIWLAVGLGFGLYFADRVVQFVQAPLEKAITRFMADQTLFRLGIDPTVDASQSMRTWLVEKGMVYETVYMVDEDAVKKSESAIKADAVEKAPAAISEPNNEIDKKDKAAADKAAADEVPATEAPVLKDAASAEDSLEEKIAATSDVPDVVFRDPENHLRSVTIWRPAGAGLSSFQMEETFMIWLKAGLVVGAVIGSPGIFFHIWHFVAAGLYPHERKYVYVYMPFSVVLFISGVVLAFFLVLKYVLDFLLQFNTALNVDLVPRLSNYVNFVLLLPLGFGIAFQLPLVMLFLQRIGLFETNAYISSWRIAVLVIAVLSMILTPADIYSMIALMVPLILLYFLGIGLCKYMPKGRGIGSEGYDPA